MISSNSKNFEIEESFIPKIKEENEKKKNCEIKLKEKK